MPRKLRRGGTQAFLLELIIEANSGSRNESNPLKIWPQIGQAPYHRALNGLIAKGYVHTLGGLFVTDRGVKAYTEVHNTKEAYRG